MSDLIPLSQIICNIKTFGEQLSSYRFVNVNGALVIRRNEIDQGEFL